MNTVLAFDSEPKTERQSGSCQRRFVGRACRRNGASRGEEGMNLDVLSDLCCPESLVRSLVVDFTPTENGLRSDLDVYPVVDGVPDLRFPTDREGTSYDNILPQWAVSRDENVLMGVAKAMNINEKDIRGKKILLAGTGTGFELDMALLFEPRVIYALDFSSFLITPEIQEFKRSLLFG